MKIYKCDSCGRMIKDPYREKMKEFYIVLDDEFGICIPRNRKRRTKVDICSECWWGLRQISEKALEAKNHERPDDQRP